MNRKTFIVYLSIAVFVVIGIPFFIDWVIIGNQFPSHINNSEWVSFFGGYIGAVIGGVFSLIGIYLTIRFTRNQNRIDRELQIRPCFDIVSNRNNEFPDIWKGYVQIITYDNYEMTENASGTSYLYFKNVGNGSATNVNFKVKMPNTSFSHQEYYNNKNAMVSGYSVSPNERAAISLIIYCNKPIDIEEQEKQSNNNECFPEGFSFKLLMSYNDLIENYFEMELSFSVVYQIQEYIDGSPRYTCDIHLTNVGKVNVTPKKL